MPDRCVRALILASLSLFGLLLSACGAGAGQVPRDTPEAADVPLISSTSGGCPEDPPNGVTVTSLEVFAVPSLAEPPSRRWFSDPTFGTCLVRVTDRGTDLSPDDVSVGIVNEYARVQAFNADGTRMMVRGTDGTWYLYDATTLLPLGELALGVEPRWDPSDPRLLYYSDETRLMSFNVQSGAQDEIHDFASDFPNQDLAAVWTRYEGSPSQDRRMWGLLAQDTDWESVALVVYDRQTDQVTIRDMRSIPGVEDGIDHVTMSPLGTYLLASFDRACESQDVAPLPGASMDDDVHPCGLMVYDRKLENERNLLRVVGHYDTVLDARGQEAIIFQDIDNDYISMLDLESGEVIPLWPIDFSHTSIGFHFSGLAFDRPGWAVVSTHDDHVSTCTWMDDGIFAVELKPSGRVVRLAHTQSVVDDEEESDYWAEPHASTNSDLTRIVFGTNWGRSGTGKVEMFMIALPADWAEQLP